MSVEKYLPIIQDELNMKIVNFARIPRDTEEVVSEVKTYLRQRYASLYRQDMEVRAVAASRLGNLESIGALQFDNEKWQATPKFLDILSKYFGIKY